MMDGKLHAAINRLAALFPNGALKCDTDPSGFLGEVADEIDRLRKENESLISEIKLITSPEECAGAVALKLRKENAELRDALRWRKVKEELPRVGELALPAYVVDGQLDPFDPCTFNHEDGHWYGMTYRVPCPPDVWLPIPPLPENER